MEKSAQAFRTISEVAQDLDLPQHVLRFWETRFVQIRPLKRGGGRRYYRPEDVDLLRAIRRLLYGEGYTIKGVQKILKEQGVRVVAATYGDATLPHAPLPIDLMAGDQAFDDDDDADLQAAVEPRRVMAASPAAAGTAEDYNGVSAARPGLSGVDRDLLQGVLTELVECTRILDVGRDA
jgi:DNA-binding transcriptional MerR regulator